MSLRHQVDAFAVLQSRIAGYMENRLRHPKIEVQLSYARVRRPAIVLSSATNMFWAGLFLMT